ncbi:MAG: hypothetical protein IPG07_01175 [Crocinitomicaceae bacterium]|nr:hypothetical protein [Crocinitomicaceae bacterium]
MKFTLIRRPYASIDANSNTYEVGVFSLNEIFTLANFTNDTKEKIELLWKGDKSKVKYIEFTSWTYLSRFRDFYFYNEDQLVQVSLEYNSEGPCYNKLIP